MVPVPRLRAYGGPALLSYGFRPFFLLGTIYAGCAILVWLPVFYGELSIATILAPRDWHVHEMVFGFVSAVVTGFLLTAVPNWTGRLPIQGRPLLILTLLWIAGRFAVTLSAWIGWLPSAVVDASFLLVVAAVIAREIIAGHNWKNLKVVAIVSVLAGGNIAFHLEAHLYGTAEYATRLGIGLIVLLIVLIGGRIVPSFTHNWLSRRGPGRLPAPLNRFDLVAILASLTALALWVVAPAGPLIGIALAFAGLLQVARLARWAGYRTVGEPLVLILHVGYAFIPIGFLLTAAAAFNVIPASVGIHSWAIGAAGTMTLAVMSRASLGHTGRELVASTATRLIYALVVVAACARIVAVLAGQWSEPFLHVAAFAWTGAFLGFAIVYGPALCRPRKTAGVVAP